MIATLALIYAAGMLATWFFMASDLVKNMRPPVPAGEWALAFFVGLFWPLVTLVLIASTIADGWRSL